MRSKLGAWFHIDGAYGALAAIARPQQFAGMDLADSVSLDPHKWLYQPLDCGCLLFRDPSQARRTFSFTGDYAKSLQEDPLEDFAFFDESLELSRRFRALKLWLSLRYHGLSSFPAANRKRLAMRATAGVPRGSSRRRRSCWRRFPSALFASATSPTRS